MRGKQAASGPSDTPSRYAAIIERVFKRHHQPGLTEFEFTREEFAEVAKELGIALPKNLGDAIYSFRAG